MKELKHELYMLLINVGLKPNSSILDQLLDDIINIVGKHGKNREEN